MPAKSPPVGDLVAASLRALGGRIRARRELQKVSATIAAEAAGMSRVTLHRVERGEPSVTMGAYLNAIAAVGIQLELTNAQAPKAASRDEAAAGVPHRVQLDDYPQLKHLAWQLPGVTELTAAEALSLYERNWRHVDQALMQPGERALLQVLVTQLGGGRLLV